MKKRPFKIIFITSTNLACNPRCLKEIELAYESGYGITVFAFDINNWTRKVEKQIRERLIKLNYHSLQTARTPYIPWLLNALVAKAAKFLYQIGWRSSLISAVVTDKRTLTLLSALRKKDHRADLIIAHNPGAFYPAWWLSKKTGIPFAIDVEDYHPGENNGIIAGMAVTGLMNSILPDAGYVSFASPMIMETTLLQFKKRGLLQPLLVNNVFPFHEFPKPECNHNATDKLKLIWFSQHISFGRGLDEILPVLEPFSNRLQLTLIGNLDLNFKAAVLDKYTFLIIKDPMNQQNLNAGLGEHDIGLALESSRSNENRKICLTNKIWAYLQAGLYIWATNTPAQIRFAGQFPLNTSIIDSDNSETVIALIRKTLENLSQVRKDKITRWEINKKVSWEIEKVNLVKQWDAIIQK